MNKKIILFLTFSIILIFGFITYKVIYKNHYYQTKNNTSDNVSGVEPQNCDTKPEAILQNFKLQQANQNKKENWILTANVGKIFHASNKIECEKLKCVFTKNNKIMAVLNSQNGFVDQNKKEANLHDNVFGNLYDLDFEGKNIKYDFNKHIITSNEKAIYKHPNFKMFTNSSMAEIKKNKLSMKNGIETEIYLN